MHDIALRSAIVTLKATGMSTAEVHAITDVSKRTINETFARAIARGFDPAVRPLAIKEFHVKDEQRSGRPLKDPSKVVDKVKSKIRCDRYEREEVYTQIAAELNSEGYYSNKNSEPEEC